MLTSIAEKLWGSTTGSTDVVSPPSVASTHVPPGEVPEGQDLEDLLEQVTCSLWEVDGTEAKEVVEEAHIELGKAKLIVKKGGGSKREFSYGEISHFHQHEADIFQWLVKKGAENADEFGMVVSNVDQAAIFNTAIRPRLRESAELLCREPIEFCTYDAENRKWISLEPDASISLLQRKKDLEAYLVIQTVQGKVLSEIGVSHEEYIFPQVSEKQLSWWGPSASCDRKMYAAKFGESGDMDKVMKTVQRLLGEHSHGERRGSDAAPDYDDKDFVLDTGNKEDDIEFLDADEIKPEDIVCRDTTRAIAAKTPTSKVHKMMFVGDSRTFVVRGPVKGAGGGEVSVLKFAEDGKQEIVTTIGEDKLGYKDNANLCPSKGILGDGESKLLFVDDKSDTGRNIYGMDIENQKVVQAYSTGGLDAQNMMHRKKDDDSSQEFLCSNGKSLFTVDTRSPGTRAEGNRTTTLNYATNVQFSCGTTDCDGHVLLGSKMGDMRLYDGDANKEGKFKRAKTHLPGIGDPLLHVAVTRDGSWILGTCAKYLVLFPVKLAATGKTGFVSALGKSKPPPIILKLSMDDMLKYKLSDVNFTKAEFNKDETAIVTSTGNLAIVWDFGKAVKGGAVGIADGPGSVACSGAGRYTIRVADDYIKDVDFVKSGDKNIVVATPCDITTKAIRA